MTALSAAARRRFTAAAWIAGVWTFVALLQATQRYLRGRELEASPWAFWSALVDNLVIAALWAAATPLVMRLARRWAFPGTPVPALAAVHLAAGVAFALLHSLAANVLYKLLLAPGVTWSALVANFLESAMTTGPTKIATYLQIVGVTWGLDDYRAWREREIRASSLQLALAKERLESLKLQLHPAFLFQTLALLRTTIPRDPRAAARTIVELGDLLRLSLKNGGKRFVRLSEELRYAELYLKIEKTRLDCELAVTIRVPREALDAAVPSLVLQPLVEAAVAAACPSPASIEITASHGSGRMTLAVRAEPADPAAPPAAALPSTAVIERARRRLDLEYPGQHRLEWSSAAREATVEIPFAPLPDGAVEPPASIAARPAEGLAR